MIFAASNIAWPCEYRLQAYAALLKQGFEGLEIAPSLFFFDADDPFNPAKQQFDRARSEIADFSLSLVSMQSVLFGVGGAELFGGVDALLKFETGMCRAIRLAGQLGVPNIVFGSPKQRIVPKNMSEQRALDRAIEVFRRLGAVAQSEGTVIAIEANPAVYGTNFLTHGESALDFVRHTEHPAVRFNLDIGAMHINGDFCQTHTLIKAAGNLISHVHFSEALLAPAPHNSMQALQVIATLQEIGYDRAVSIEMRAPVEAPIATVSASIIRLADARRLANI